MCTSCFTFLVYFFKHFINIFKYFFFNKCSPFFIKIKFKFRFLALVPKNSGFDWYNDIVQGKITQRYCKSLITPSIVDFVVFNFRFRQVLMKLFSKCNAFLSKLIKFKYFDFKIQDLDIGDHSWVGKIYFSVI